ncbi:MAG: PadR family transcriptional regulator, partial [Firmicutes bacterium]|nr:PadR family transcriptional regulator [Bacillota bacterium]
MPADGGGRRQELLPLTESTFYILISLARPRHGYGIIQAVREMSGGRVELGPGTLYGALNRLLRQGL